MEDPSFVCIVSEAKNKRKDSVQLHGGVPPRIKLRSPRTIPVGTKVLIRNGRRQALGVVDKCRISHSTCILTVEIQRGGRWLMDLIPMSNFDPGAHSVNKFICDEGFLQLMKEMDSNNHIAGMY